MRLSAREEIVVELFRKLHADQKNEAVKHLRSTIDANYEVEKRLGRPLKPVSNERVAAKYGKTPPPMPRAPKNKPQPRRPDRAQDDNE